MNSITKKGFALSILSVIALTTPLSMAFARENENESGDGHGGPGKTISSFVKELNDTRREERREDRRDDRREERREDRKEDRREDRRDDTQVKFKKDGRVKLMEAKVTGITGNTLAAETVRGATTTVWTLVTSSSTDFMLKNSRSATLADVAVGDRINSDGVLTATSSTVINASAVRILKDKKVTPVVLSRHIFDGTLASLSGSTTPATLGLTMGSTTYSVNVPAGTLILGKNWLLSNLSNFSIGNNVRIFGSLASSTSHVINAVVVRNATNN